MSELAWDYVRVFGPVSAGLVVGVLVGYFATTAYCRVRDKLRRRKEE